MNRKAQGALGIGVIMVAFISIIVGVILFTAIAQQAGDVTNTVNIENETFTAAANGASVYLDYRSLGGTVVMTNATGGEVIDAGNYTITNNAIDPSDGTLSVQVQTDATDYQSVSWNVSSDSSQPQTYVGGAANSIAGLIAIFFALAIAIVALEPTLRSGVLNMLGR